MKYRIEFKRSAAKALKKIPKSDQRRIRDRIDDLSGNLPNPASYNVAINRRHKAE